MIIEAFSDHIKNFNADIPAIIVLSKWLREKLTKEPQDNVEKVLQTEISIMKNKRGIFLMIAKSESGKKLLESLYEYALSYDGHKFSRWVHKVKASDFN